MINKKIKHLVWIDSYRGLLILLVTLGHLSVPIHVFDGIRIPAFFFISGYLFSQSYNNFSYFFRHRFLQIVVPYMVFFFMVYLLTIVINSAMGKDIDILNPILAMVYGSFSWDMGYSKSLWFVTALFTTEIYFFFIKKYINDSKLILVILLAFSALGYITTFLDFRLPWGMDVACTIILFYGLGYLVKIHGIIDLIDIKNIYFKLFIAVSLLLLSYYFSYGEYAPIFVLNKISNPVFTMLSGIFGILATILLLKISFINTNNFLVYFGKNTFIILAFHEFIMHISAKIIFVVAGFDVKDSGLVVMIGYVLVTIMLIIPVIELINRLFPFILNHNK